MKAIVPIMTLGLIVASAPAWAYSRYDGNRRHISYQVDRHHHQSYKWNYRSEREERRATEDLNRQYRGARDYR